MPGADRFLTTLGAQLIADGLPLAGGALTQAAPHPIIARRVWLWRADTGAVIEALGFGAPGALSPGGLNRRMSALTGSPSSARGWCRRMSPAFRRRFTRPQAARCWAGLRCGR